jgi:hypothetical protein
MRCGIMSPNAKLPDFGPPQPSPCHDPGCPFPQLVSLCQMRVLNYYFPAPSTFLGAILPERAKDPSAYHPSQLPVFAHPRPMQTHCSLAIIFMPSSKGPVTLMLRYLRILSPCGCASTGTAKPGSGCCDAALELPSWPLMPLLGVPVRAGGAGLSPLVVACAAGAGDFEPRKRVNYSPGCGAA